MKKAEGRCEMRSAVEWDREFLELFRRGERSATEQVYWAYLASVDRMVRRLLRFYGGKRPVSAANVEELVQESFTRAFGPMARQAYDGLRDYGAYLHTIVRNTVADALRLQRREVLAGDTEIGVWLAMEDVAAAQDPSSWIDPVTAARVRDYLSRLPLNQQSVHYRRYVLDEAQDVAADTLGITRQRIRTLEKKLRLGLLRELNRTRAKKPSTGVAASPAWKRSHPPTKLGTKSH
jgi:RNA polymerase sigma factor (sigma-70 family)